MAKVPVDAPGDSIVLQEVNLLAPPKNLIDSFNKLLKIRSYEEKVLGVLNLRDSKLLSVSSSGYVRL